jgi:hypothetical protein
MNEMLTIGGSIEKGVKVKPCKAHCKVFEDNAGAMGYVICYGGLKCRLDFTLMHRITESAKMRPKQTKHPNIKYNHFREEVS